MEYDEQTFQFQYDECKLHILTSLSWLYIDQTAKTFISWRFCTEFD